MSPPTSRLPLPDWLVALRRMHLDARLDFEAAPRLEPIRVGAAMHGALGRACLALDGAPSPDRAPAEGLYASLFGPPPPRGLDVFLDGQRTPALALSVRVGMRGSTVEVGLDLPPKAEPFVPRLVAALELAGRLGLGPERVPFRVSEVRANGAAIYEPVAWLRDPEPERVIVEEPGPAGPTILRALSPLRIVREGRELREPTLEDLVVAAARRLAGYAHHHDPQGDAIPNVQSLVASLALPDVREARWERHARRRYSRSTDREHPLEGAVGELQLESGAESSAAIAIVLGGARLGLGKGVSMGYGRLELLERHGPPRS
ncbi:MAG: CRISPR system precrRNA processing endoribonuclease RAMP protein Cas6 [Polyangiales bacterium]